MKQVCTGLGFCLVTLFSFITFGLNGTNLPGPNVTFEVIATVTDTIPIKDRYGDFVTDDYYNPFDITPSIIDQQVEYDFETGKYVVLEKIGEEYYRTPTYLSITEYLAWQQKKQEAEYFQKLAGIKSKDFTRSLELDPMSEIDVDALLLDRLFGGNEIEIKPTGNIDIEFGFFYQDVRNPNIPPETQTQFGFPDFDMDINMGVEGKIGDKLNLGFNYNTAATFDFDNKLNLGYGSDLWDEDDIIKTIEAGNINFPLPGQLIQGQQNLFGLKTELQFGKFFLTALASQSRSERENISLENGKLIQDFELRPDQYDENRHFFISHYYRDNYEQALQNIPQVQSLARISSIEVWVTNDQNNDLTNTAMVVSIEQLGESDPSKIADPNPSFPPLPFVANHEDINNKRLPSNRNSELFTTLINDPQTRGIDNAATRLQANYGMQQTRDFELQNMRRLNTNEYTFNAELGYISLNQKLRPNQVLGVSFEYTYTLNGDEIYKVGEMTNESNRGGFDEEQNPKPEDVIFVKLLKSSNQQPGQPSWDLMMKNVYGLNTAQLTQDEFLLDIFYEDNATASLKRFIPEPIFRETPLLTLFQLDQLNVYGDPQEDGIFDFVQGITVNSRTGSIIFPVLEPFGSSLLNLLNGDQELYEKYGYPRLYENTVTNARNSGLNRNRFLIKGRVKSNFSSEISLGAFEIPRGSVTVRAGSQILTEDIDYSIDYSLGRLKILNESFLQQGVPIDVSFEDQGLFNLQQKTMFGLRGEYRFNDNFTLGATYMRLFERPFTQKVNIGEDPINNRMFGLDLNLTADAPGITRLVDKLPFYSTDQPSSITVSAEVAAIRPGHSGAINIPEEDEGVLSVDDFEGANSGIPLGSRPNLWYLASPNTSIPSVPTDFVNNELAGVNRALINWHVIDNRTVRRNQEDSYTRRILQTELFDRQLDISQIPDLRTFDISFFPEERGPYNFDLPEGTEVSSGLEFDRDQNRMFLKDPSTRWGGIMRYLPNNDFEAANYEYIEFWMMNPFMETEDFTHVDGEDIEIRIHLGNVSEDILPDRLQFYENAIPVGDENIPTASTVWGDVPLSIPNVKGFDLNDQEAQDLGLDGLTDEGERIKYSEYVQAIEDAFVFRLDDVANDNYQSFLDDSFSEEVPLFERYKRFNNPQGNAPTRNQSIGLGNPVPDAEDLNDNRSLETNEAYYEYTLSIRNTGGEIDRSPTTGGADRFITDERTTTNPATMREEKWYRFQIPIMTAGRPEGDIQGFRTIQFMRMMFSNFQTAKTFRLAEFELVRNQWRRLDTDESCSKSDDGLEFVVNEVGLQENSRRTPFNYVLPRGIKQERIFSTFSNVLQDENSLSIRTCAMPDDCELMISKLTELDVRRFERLQMFVHAEERDELLEDGDLSIFVRLGKDFTENYYEYAIPLTFSDSMIANQFIDTVSSGAQAYSNEVWREENMIDFPLTLFTDIKRSRNNDGAPVQDTFSMLGLDTANLNAQVTIKGNPSLGLIKGMVIGVRNTSGGKTLCTEVWVNELRLKGLDNRGGVAGQARVDINMADLGNITGSINYNSIGWGQIDQQIQERSLEKTLEYDIATNIDAGKLLPKKWNVSVPLYYQYARSTSTPEFDPLELDLTKDQLLENTNLTDIQRQDIIERQNDVTTISTFNLTNVRKNRTGKGSPKPWDVSNLRASYSFSRTKHSDEIIKQEIADDQRGELNYSYTPKTKPFQPFKNIKAKPLRFIKEINFNPIPNSFEFNTQMQRYKSSRLFRLPDPSEGFEYVFDDQRFNWNRTYSLSWDLAKSLKLNYDASATAVVDELKQVGVASTADNRRWEDVRGSEVDGDGRSYTESIANDPNFVNKFRNENLQDFGRMKLYDQGISISYNVPFKYLPGLDWITAQAQYNGDYTWSAGSLTAEFLGNVIQNQQQRTLRTSFDFEKLYDKLDYFKKLNGKRVRSTRRTRSTKDGDDKDEQSSGKSREISTVEKIFIRPLLSLRELKFNYREEMSTVIPGYTRAPKFFGLTGSDPGWGFVLGAQPDLENFFSQRLDVNSDNPIITTSNLLNQQVLQNNAQTYEADLTIEPWKGFSIDVDFRKKYVENHSEYFLNTQRDPNGPLNYERILQRQVGSFEMTYVALNTLFDSDIDGLFQRFDDNRKVISSILPNNGSGLPHDDDEGYALGYGRQHVDVLIPAFIAAYTNQDPNSVDLDLRSTVSRRGYIPKPNWNLRYNGLSKLGWFKDIFSNITLNHKYQNTLNVNSFASDLQFDNNDPFFISSEQSSSNYFARFEVPEIIIDERFQPIIGLDFKTHSDLNFNAEWAKTRNLRLSTSLAQLIEGRSTSFNVGFGWILQDVNIGFITGNKKQRSRRNRPNQEEGEEDTALEEKTDEEITGDGPGANGGVTNFTNKLEFSFEVQFRDDVTFIHELGDGASKEATRGTKTLNISPLINYDVNKNFRLALFFQYSSTQPKLSTSYPITNMNGGLRATFILD